MIMHGARLRMLKRDVNTVTSAAKSVVYTVGPLFAALNAAMLKKILRLSTFSCLSIHQTSENFACGVEPAQHL
jgi:hypothetical protein